MFAGKKSAQIREILISESAWEDMTCLFAPSLVLNSEQKFSLMVSAESFGELRLFRYPDGTLFNTFYRSNGDPLEGVMKTLWEMEMEITDTPVVRFEHR